MIITSDMVFDSNRKRFRLSNDFVYNELGTDLANALIDEFDTNLSTIADRTLKETSNQLYYYLRENGVKNAYGNAYDTASYLIATNQDWYYSFIDALSAQLYKFIASGKATANTGLNLEKGTKIETNILDDISKEAISIMKSAGMFHTVIRTEDIPPVEEW